VLAEAAAEFSAVTGVRADVQAVTNRRLGEGITVAGLLMGQDVIDHLKALADTGELGQLIVLPRIMFDHPDGVCLDDLAPMDIARALGRPVALADLMGDVLDAVRGQNKLTFDPAAPIAEIPTVREGGWAVEKYL
jgi:NifB/MoaA-like Fe-S oxidoreductase